MMKILIGTKNKGKLAEIKNILNNDINIISLNDLEEVAEPIEDGNNFYENALIKAKYYYEQFNIPVISDDSGLCCVGLDNKPGLLTARYASTNGLDSSSIDNYTKLLNDLKDIKNRKAYFVCEMVFYDGKNIIHTKGKMHGAIAYEPSGNHGFGYDPIFYVKKYHTTLANLDEDIKNNISHRAKALNKLKHKLDKYYINKK